MSLASLASLGDAADCLSQRLARQVRSQIGTRMPWDGPGRQARQARAGIWIPRFGFWQDFKNTRLSITVRKRKWMWQEVLPDEYFLHQRERGGPALDREQ